MAQKYTGDGPDLKEMVAAIVREADPERVYLFGSRARDEARTDADIDLLVVAREPFDATRSRFATINRLLKALPTHRIPTDILLFSSEEVEAWRDSMNHVIGRCLREGRLLYERP